MFVYIWKDSSGVPFYVGCTRNRGRTNPRNNGRRNWLCKQKITEIGVENIVVEIRPVKDMEEASVLECKLIAEYGRIQTENGTLTNLTSGGDGVHERSQELKEKHRLAMLDPNHPIRSQQSREKLKARMQSPDIKALFLGDANPAKRPEVRQKIKDKWADPAYREHMASIKIGKPIHTEEEKERRRVAIKSVAGMKSWAERNGKDPEFDAKRIEGIRAAQGKRREKMSNPVALAQRKERLKATMASPEYAAKRAAFDTPEYRAKLAAAKKAYWDKRKGLI